MGFIVTWPGRSVQHCLVTKVLEYSGLASSYREAKIYVKSGFVYVNEEPVRLFTDTVLINGHYTFEVRLPSGVIKSLTFTLAEKQYY